MRARVVPLKDIREKFGAEAKQFIPAFVIPRRYPGWDLAHPELRVFQPVLTGGKAPTYIEVKPKPRA